MKREMKATIAPVKIPLINPRNGEPLMRSGQSLTDTTGNRFPIVDGVPHFAEAENYAANFGLQWNRFAATQLDRDGEGMDLSRRRFFSATRWRPEDLAGQSVLEVGSGAGRFSKVVLEHTPATLYSVDYSDAVTANMKNNGQIAPERFHLFRAGIYQLPFPDGAFDRVFCFGVLQHTPDFDASIRALIAKTRTGGEIVVDFYPIKGWWTKLNAKYLLRPLTKRMAHHRLLALIEGNIDWLIASHLFLHRLGVGALTRFLPVCNIRDSFPATLTLKQRREWAVLDTFDQYSPAHDHPQRIAEVVRMFERHGASVTFSGFECFGEGMSAAVVRGVRRKA